MVIGPEAMHNLAEYLGPDGWLRLRNPNIVVLAYFSAGDVIITANLPIIADFVHSLKPKWYLRDRHGKHVYLFQLDGEEWTHTENNRLAEAKRGYPFADRPGTVSLGSARKAGRQLIGPILSLEHRKMGERQVPTGPAACRGFLDELRYSGRNRF